jgi:hypothetical protein
MAASWLRASSSVCSVVLVSAFRHCHIPSETKVGSTTASTSPPMIAAWRRVTLAPSAGWRAYCGIERLSGDSAMLKLAVVLLLLAIIGSLFSGLFFLYRDRASGQRMARALTWRIGLSIMLFLLLLAGFRFGLIPGYSQ